MRCTAWISSLDAKSVPRRRLDAMGFVPLQLDDRDRDAPLMTAAAIERASGWSGIVPAALTMFTASGELDDDATAAHLERLIADGAHGVVIGGTSGEFALLNEAERERLIEIGVEAVSGRVPVIAGTGYVATRETIRLTRRAEQLGADGAIVILPYFQRPTAIEVERHYVEVGSATGLPVMIYNNPANTAAPPLEVAAIRRLWDGGHAHAVKSTFPTVHQVHELRAELPDRFRVFYGSFMAPMEGLAGGAHGWISGILNVVTAEAVELWNAVAIEGDLQRGREIWRRILPIKLLWTRTLLGPLSDLAIYRAILQLRGLHGGSCRAPITAPSSEQLRALEAFLVEHGLDRAVTG
jgi:4-hydroxy-tetrahydrodipicolinate synthase